MSEKWVTAWGNAISVAERRPENYAKDLTLRYPAKMMLDGSALRITLDNFCGSEPVTVTAVSAAVSDGADGIDTETIVPLTFSGKTSVTIPAGEWVQSDAVRFPVKRGETIAVSLYFAGFTEMRSGVVITGPLSGGYFAVGNQTEEAVLGMDTSKKTHTVYFLSDIDVLTDEGNRTLICYGDSITAQAWPDELMLRTLENGDGTTAVIRKAASGTRILRQYDNITYDSYGLKGETRFPREIQVSGAYAVLIQHGVPRLLMPPDRSAVTSRYCKPFCVCGNPERQLHFLSASCNLTPAFPGHLTLDFKRPLRVLSILRVKTVFRILQDSIDHGAYI